MDLIQDSIEEKAYDKDCDEAIVAALNKRIYIYEPGIIYIREVPVPSPFTVSFFANKSIDLVNHLEKCSIIIDLREANRPDAQTRRMLNEKILELADQKAFVSFYTNGIFLNTAIRFVMYGMDMKSYAVSSNFDKVLASARDALK